MNDLAQTGGYGFFEAIRDIGGFATLITLITLVWRAQGWKKDIEHQVQDLRKDFGARLYPLEYWVERLLKSSGTRMDTGPAPTKELTSDTDTSEKTKVDYIDQF